MPIDLRRIVEAQKKALALVESPEKREALERFLESSGPLLESAARDALHEMVEEMNAQLAPHARVRLVQEGSRLLAEVVSLGEETGRRRTVVIDSDSISKVLVRMPSEVKTRATEAAQRAGTSLNSWTVTVLDRALSNLRERQKRAEERQAPGETTPNGDPDQGPGPRE
ncbi:MAG: hypothetical protein QF659_07560 [Dehalococcoidia bacterium]|jgi:hypothetical protein|nr:hypothetical protein [Dehalococcoidia bacterium]|tara:strand:- start:78 stop:584 length:507 start_codon:yes stop_codon:yes gene_type:complete